MYIFFNFVFKVCCRGFSLFGVSPSGPFIPARHTPTTESRNKTASMVYTYSWTGFPCEHVRAESPQYDPQPSTSSGQVIEQLCLEQHCCRSKAEAPFTLRSLIGSTPYNTQAVGEQMARALHSTFNTSQDFSTLKACSHSGTTPAPNMSFSLSGTVWPLRTAAYHAQGTWKSEERGNGLSWVWCEAIEPGVSTL